MAVHSQEELAMTQWQVLMKAWQSLQSVERAARSARASAGGDTRMEAESRLVEEQALEGLARLKDEIDAIILQSFERREPRSGALVLASFVKAHEDELSGSDGNRSGAPVGRRTDFRRFP